MRRSPAKRTGELLGKLSSKLRAEGFSQWISRHSNGLGWVMAAMLFAVPLVIVGRNYDAIGTQNDKIERQNHRLEAQNQKLEAQSRHLVRERVQRIRVQNAINAYICTTNNEQDGLLASLIAVSLAYSPSNSKLTNQQRAGKAIFEQALVQLEDTTECKSFRLPPPGVIPNPEKIPKPRSDGVGSGGMR